MRDYNINSIFQTELLSGESIVWTGQPDPSKLFTKGDILLIPFSLLWFGFAVFWESMALSIPSEAGLIDFIFPLFGLPFVIIGLHFVIGRFFYKHFKRKKTYYAVTNKRVLIKSVFLNKSIEALFIKDLAVINKVNKSDMTGDIIFGNLNFNTSLNNDSGMELVNFNNVPRIPAFYDIEHVDHVYEKIVNAKYYY